MAIKIVRGSSSPDVVYVRRDANGEVMSVSLVQSETHFESLHKTSPELAIFSSRHSAGEEKYIESDLSLVRVLEDLVQVLIDKDVIKFTDLPEAAQEKLLSRKSMRHLDLLSDEEEEAVI